jgi:hypothetical protein
MGDATSRSASQSVVLISESNACAAGPCSEWELVLYAFFDGELDKANCGQCHGCLVEVRRLKSVNQDRQSAYSRGYRLVCSRWSAGRPLPMGFHYPVHVVPTTMAFADKAVRLDQLYRPYRLGAPRRRVDLSRYRTDLPLYRWGYVGKP